MISLHEGPTIVLKDDEIIPAGPDQAARYAQRTGHQPDLVALRQGTIAYPILKAHDTTEGDATLNLKFDSITSHDITFVGIIQTAVASGMQRFPLPYILTNCHNSLCAVGGTINEDDHKFGLAAARKFGGIVVPPNLAVIHTYNREEWATSGGMILGSDSHTRYGALGTMAIGEGGGELAKQLLGQTYDVRMPQVVGIMLRGKPNPGVGPQDVALQIIKAVFASGFTTNKVMEFIGSGVHELPVEYRNGIDVMTTETTCLSSIWRTDEKVARYYEIHRRPSDYRELREADEVCYDGVVEVDLSAIKPSIALPFHPSNVYTIEEVVANPMDVFDQVEKDVAPLYEGLDVTFDLKRNIVDGKVQVQQGVIVGCSGGTFDNIVAARDVLKGASVGDGAFNFSVYPGSLPINLSLVRQGVMADLLEAGTVSKPAFCGPCFGAGDTPANNELSIRHATRNFPNRDGSKPGEGQMSAVALMDSRSIAATAANHGILTAADTLDIEYSNLEEEYDPGIYEKRVYNGLGKPQPETELVAGPNIKPWPEMPEVTENVLLKVVSHITDPVTTTDELMPSGETSSYRSNPIKLSDFTLSRKDPGYVAASKEVRGWEQAREAGEQSDVAELTEALDLVKTLPGFEGVDVSEIGLGSTIYANRPGDGSAREQAASGQRVVGAWANLAKEYATKRYRSNLINWGIIPFLVDDSSVVKKGDYVFVPDARQAILDGRDVIQAYVLNDSNRQIDLRVGDMTEEEREILVSGSLINHNRAQQG